MVATSSTINAIAPKPAKALAIRLGLKFNLSEFHGIKRLFSSKPSDGSAPYLQFATNSHPLIIQPPTAISRQSGSVNLDKDRYWSVALVSEVMDSLEGFEQRRQVVEPI